MQLSRFKNKNVIITGAAGEMAQFMCKTLLKEEAFVYLIDFDKENLDQFAQELKNESLKNFETVIADISKESIIQTIEDFIDKKDGKIDILINHAGVSSAESLEKTTIEFWKRDISINLNGTYFCTKAVLKFMKKQESGVIITIGSVNSESAIACPSYSAAKAAMLNHTKAVAMECGKFNIRANTVSPGSVMTKAWNHRIENEPKTYEKIIKWYPLKKLATPEDISKATLFLASDDAKAISGINLIVDAGLSAGSALFAKDITSEDFGA